MTKPIAATLALLSICMLGACDYTKEFDPWGKSSKNLCKRYGYNNCDGKKENDLKTCQIYGNCDGDKGSAASVPVKSCELYGNCDQ